MIGVIVNVLAVALGGVLGTVFSKKLSTRFTTELNKVFGVCAIGMGISSVPLMQNMPAVTSLVAVPQAAVFFALFFRRQGDLSAHDADDDRRLQGLRRLSAHRNGLPHRQDAGLPRGGHDPGDGARDAAERPMDKLHRAASLSAWKKAPLPKKAAVLAFLRYVNYNETDH